MLPFTSTIDKRAFRKPFNYFHAVQTCSALAATKSLLQTTDFSADTFHQFSRIANVSTRSLPQCNDLTQVLALCSFSNCYLNYKLHISLDTFEICSSLLSSSSGNKLQAFRDLLWLRDREGLLTALLTV